MNSETKPTKVTWMIPLDLLNALRRLAKAHARSVVGEVIWALRQYIARQSEEKE